MSKHNYCFFLMMSIELSILNFNWSIYWQTKRDVFLRITFYVIMVMHTTQIIIIPFFLNLKFILKVRKMNPIKKYSIFFLSILDIIIKIFHMRTKINIMYVYVCILCVNLKNNS